MNHSKLVVNKKEYVLQSVQLSISIDEYDDEVFLNFDLFADSDDLKSPGFAINCMSIQGLTSTKEIENFNFQLGDEIEDQYNELGESVICEPGKALELSYLSLQFGQVADGFIPIKMKALCFTEDEDNISVQGELFAKIDG